PATVTALTGHAWIRNSDGSRTELQVGSKIPPGAHIETDAGSSLQLLVDGATQPITLGRGRAVAYSGEMAGGVQDVGENAAQPLPGTDSDRLLAALQSGQDIFQDLDPTAAVAGAGAAGDGNTTFVVLDRIALGTSPLGVAYPG